MLYVLVQGEVVLVKINLPFHLTQQTQLMYSILIKISPDILQHSLAYDPAAYMVASVLGGFREWHVIENSLKCLNQQAAE